MIEEIQFPRDVCICICTRKGNEEWGKEVDNLHDGMMNDGDDEMMTILLLFAAAGVETNEGIGMGR